MSTRSPIVIATGNPHKVQELRAILGSDLLGLRDLEAQNLGPFNEPVETGSTFEENASIKALEYARQTGMTCLADDSGLEIDALGGRPGVISSHYATDGRQTVASRSERDAANNARVLCELHGVPFNQRAARFVCVMVLAQPRRVLAASRGAFEGRIGSPPQVPRGRNGFGYDPLFLVAPDFTRTSAELDPGEKNRLSHRAQAAAAMRVRLIELGLMQA